MKLTLPAPSGTPSESHPLSRPRGLVVTGDHLCPRERFQAAGPPSRPPPSQGHLPPSPPQAALPGSPWHGHSHRKLG